MRTKGATDSASPVLTTEVQNLGLTSRNMPEAQNLGSSPDGMNGAHTVGLSPRVSPDVRTLAALVRHSPLLTPTLRRQWLRVLPFLEARDRRRLREILEPDASVIPNVDRSGVTLMGVRPW